MIYAKGKVYIRNTLDNRIKPRQLLPLLLKEAYKKEVILEEKIMRQNSVYLNTCAISKAVSNYSKTFKKINKQEQRNWEFIVHDPSMIDLDKLKEVLTSERPLLILKGVEVSRIYFHKSLLAKAHLLNRERTVLFSSNQLAYSDYVNCKVDTVIQWAREIKNAAWPKKYPAYSVIAYQPKV